MALYDKYYKEENYFGDPYPELVSYIKTLDISNTIVDLGCGQGRDILAFGRLGFKCIGYDLSKVGIEQLNNTAKNENIDVTGIVGDYSKVDSINQFDIVLMNSMFHFYKTDIEVETSKLINILTKMKNQSKIILIIQYSKKRQTIIKNILENHNSDFIVVFKTNFIYEKFTTHYDMFVIEKRSS